MPQDLITHVAAELVDIAIVYAPQHRPGLEIDLLMEEELVLVSTSSDQDDGNAPPYVHVEWGSDVSLHLAESFPDMRPSIVANLESLALNYVLREGGSGYIRMNAVRPYLAEGLLHRVSGAP